MGIISRLIIQFAIYLVLQVIKLIFRRDYTGTILGESWGSSTGDETPTPEEQQWRETVDARMSESLKKRRGSERD